MHLLIRRRLAVLTLTAACALASPAAAQRLSAADVILYESAFGALEADHWEVARAQARMARDPLLGKVFDWMRLRRDDSDAGFAEIAAFVEANPDWPWLASLRRKAEQAPDLRNAGDRRILEWFAANPPATAEGRIRHAEALIRAGRTGEAGPLLRAAYVEGGLGARQEADFLSGFGRYLQPGDHVARLDRLVWGGNEDAARRVMGRVDPGHRALAHARLLLRAMRPGVEAAIAAVPASLRNDPGLAYERVRWRRQKGLDDGAREILLSPPATLGRPDLWWTEREVQVRRALDSGHISIAYRLAAAHGQTEGIGLADGEWLAGWIALRSLNDPKAAYGHFERLHAGVSTPVSKARGLYWMGRAAEASGDAATAAARYGEAGRYVSTFYGQLALDRSAAKPVLTVPHEPGQAEAAAFAQKELVRTVQLMVQAGGHRFIDPFLVRLDELAANDGERVLVARLALEAGRADAAVRLARSARRDGVIFAEAGYPVTALPRGDWPEAALTHAVIRQESGFDARAVSRAGALGMMQLLPGTAQDTARREGMAYSKVQLTLDPVYNITLGRAYLRQMLDRFGGSHVLALAAYNAGPGRAQRWIEAYGDPRDPDVDVIDWIETIPFSETRNYVQRLLEALQIYRWRLGAPEVEIALADDLASGSWDREAQVACSGRKLASLDKGC